MIRNILAVGLALAFACTSWGQSIQQRAQSSVNRGAQAVNQTPQQAATQANQVYNRQTQATQGQAVNQRAMNPVNTPVNSLEPIATTTPDQATDQQQFYSQPQQYYYNNYSNYRSYNVPRPVQQWQQVQPIRRTWNFTRSFIPFGR